MNEEQKALALYIVANYPVKDYPSLYLYATKIEEMLMYMGTQPPPQRDAFMRSYTEYYDAAYAKDVTELATNPALLQQRLQAHSNKQAADQEAAQVAQEAARVAEVQQVRLNPAITINKPSPSTLQDVQRFIEQAIRNGNSYDAAIEEAYNNFPASLVNQATGRS